jgi:glycosyltransferase involved in cell wall biosynthesis
MAGPTEQVKPLVAPCGAVAATSVQAMKPRFSIVIPVHNRRDYLVQALASCIRQTARDFEVVVSDDCSTDDLAAVVQSFADPRIRFERSSERLGAARNHQMAVTLARGEYVLTLHSDDFLLPQCLEAAGGALDANTAAAAVYYSMTYLVGSSIDGFHPVPGIAFADRETWRNNPWLEKFPATNPTCCLFRRSAFDALGGYRTDLRFVYDYDLYFRFLTAAGGVIFLPQILCVYRKHAQQAAETSNVDGLCDMFDLWRSKEYSHWPSSEIAGLVLTQLGRMARAGHSFSPVFEHIRRRRLTWTLLKGLPGALGTKLRQRVLPKRAEDPNYRRPLDAENAVAAARLVLGQL